MTNPKINTLPEKEAIERIVETVQQADEGDAPFALVLGAGFSHGLVPTAKELVTESLPLWIHSRNEGTPFVSPSETPVEARQAIAGQFWRKFMERNVAMGLRLELDPNTGLPRDNSAAYKAAFDPNYSGAVGAPAQARKFQRMIMRLEQPRLNAAHFLLASILGVQPGKSRKSSLFKSRAAFSRLILTTNFDPFLQVALQSVNRLYFMSDTPDLGVSDEILDDQTDAIHLVYLHGSIHRRSQAATEQDIEKLKQKNAQILCPVLKRHGVIVLGYSGWDDAVAQALAACDKFDHRLYWCGLEPNPFDKAAFGPKVPSILEKPSAFYVQTSGAGPFMGQLCSRLANGLPRLLDNPIGQVKEMLATINLEELEKLSIGPAAPGQDPAAIEQSNNGTIFVEAKAMAVECLHQAETAFKNSTKAKRSLASARLAERLGNYTECLKLCDEALAVSNLDHETKAENLVIRGVALHWLKRNEESLRSFSEGIELPNAPIEQIANALLYRSWIWSELKDTEKALADYNRLIDQLPGAPVELIAQALLYRGVTWGERKETEKEMADYNRLINQLPGAPVAPIAKALVNRGWIHYKRSDYKEFLADSAAALRENPKLDYAAFNLGLALLACGRDEEAIAAYKHAGETFPAKIERLGLDDLADAQKSWLSTERAAPVIKLLQSLKTAPGN